MRGRTTNVSRNDNSRLFIRNEARVEVEMKHIDHYEQSTLKNKKRLLALRNMNWEFAVKFNWNIDKKKKVLFIWIIQTSLFKQISLNLMFCVKFMKQNYTENWHVIKLLKVSILGINTFRGYVNNGYQDMSVV